MTTFYFFRHGYSCSNYLKDKSPINYGLTYFSEENKDPHLTDWGILGSILAGRYLESKFSKITFNKAYVSPLIRTWETGACMFPDKIPDQTFYVGPYLTEGRPDIKEQQYAYTIGASNTPEEYEKNLKKFDKFKKHINELKTIFSEKKSNQNSLDKEKSNQNSLDKEKSNQNNLDYVIKRIDKIQKVKIINDKDYDERYTLKGSIEKFINLKKKEGGNILVICHGTILLKDFVKNNNNKLYENIKNIGHNNNFGIKVEIKEDQQKIELFFKGITKPKKDYTEFSLCDSEAKINKNKYKKIIDKNTNIIPNKSMNMLSAKIKNLKIRNTYFSKS